jgi:exonuclease SbcC
MKLLLKNFRCYLEKEFDFGVNGMLLLSGGSGIGKTSILMAINFVLYGTGTKVVANGKTSCIVELIFENLKITRTKRPNRVVLVDLENNASYEDDSAQSIINQKFGNAFDVTSYVHQNAINSFIMMSPLEKLGFLEKFAFQGIDLTQIKIKCKNAIQKANTELIAVSSQLQMATDHLSTMQKPAKVPFPLKGTDRELAIEKENKRMTNCKIKIKNVTKGLEQLKKRHSQLSILNVKISSHLVELERLESSKKTLEDSIKSIYYVGDDEVRKMEETIQIVIAHRELHSLQIKYDQDVERLDKMKTNELENMKQSIELLNKKLWKEYSKEEVDENIKEYKDLYKDSSRLETLKKQLETYKVNETQLTQDKEELVILKKKLTDKKELLTKLKLQKEVYACPKCKSQLRFHDESLHLFNETIEHDEENIEDVEKEIYDISRKVNKLEYQIPDTESKLRNYNEAKDNMVKITSQYEDDIPNKEEIQTSIEELQNYKRSQEEIERKLDVLKSNVEQQRFPTSFQTLEESIKNQRKRLKTLKSDCVKDVSNIDEQELQTKIQVNKRNAEKIKETKSRVTNLLQEIQDRRKTIIELEEDLKDDSISNIVSEIEEKTTELEHLNEKLQKYSDNSGKIELYKKYKEDLERYNEWIQKVKVLKADEKEKSLTHSAMTKLKEKILQAESIAILNIVDSINIHAQEYLDTFFPADPIVVRLLPFKEVKSGVKPQINLQIDYKGMEADITMLSGGELSRVVLAYTLALSEIFNSPMILLDECTASLDQELTSVVIEGIRKNFIDKMVIVIAHQVVGGIFDRIISL